MCWQSIHTWLGPTSPAIDGAPKLSLTEGSRLLLPFCAHAVAGSGDRFLRKRARARARESARGRERASEQVRERESERARERERARESERERGTEITRARGRTRTRARARARESEIARTRICERLCVRASVWGWVAGSVSTAD